MEGAAGSVSDQKDGEDASGRDKIAGAPRRSLSADAPAFIPRNLLPPQGRDNSTPGAKAGGGVVSKPSPELPPSTGICTVATPPRTTSSATSGSTATPLPKKVLSSSPTSSGSHGEHSQIRAVATPPRTTSSATSGSTATPLPKKVLSSTPTSSGSHGEHSQIRAAAPPRNSSPISSASSGSTGKHLQIRSAAASSPISIASSGSTGKHPQIRAAAASSPMSSASSGSTGERTDASSKGHHPRRRGSNSSDPALLPQKNIGPRIQDPLPSSSKPQVPAYSAVLQHGCDTLQEMLKNKNDMLRYLNHVDCGHYKDQASRLGRRLTIDFCDLMWKDSKLAENICNNRGSNSYWLQDAAKTFFEDNGLPSSNVSFDFKDIPSWLRQAKEYMGTQPRVKERYICGGIAKIYEATPHGMKGADVILSGILGCVSRGISWSGKLTPEDLWFGEGPDGNIKLYIAKQPDYTTNAPTKDRLLDIHAIWPAIQGALDIHAIWPAIQGALDLVDGKLPLYFPELKMDLKNARYLPPWFFTYLLFHPALYGSMPRRHVITSLQKSLKRFKAANRGLFNSVFSCKPLSDDWRARAEKGALNLLLKFRIIKPNKKGENNASTESSAEKRKETGGHGDVFSRGETLGSDISSQNGEAPIDSQGYLDTLYVDTRDSLLGYVRNGLQHLDQYLASEDEDEIELYLAFKFPEILPDVIRGLLQTCNMGGCFASAWGTYTKSK